MAIFFINYILWHFCLFKSVYSFPLIKKKIDFYLMCMNILPACMYVYYKHALLLEAKEVIGSHKTKLEMVVNQLIRVRGNHPRSSKRASALNS